MSVNASALRKGAPPARATTKNPIEADRRSAEGKNKPLQLMVPAAGRVRGLQRSTTTKTR